MELAELINLTLFGIHPVEQLAVKYLKLSLESPFTSFVAFLSILLAAPIMEEFIFRGVLQSYLRKKLGMIPAILLASFAFALFHIQPADKLANFPLILSLFVFACYLGFLYERQRSLFSPIALHVTFNLISVIRIIGYHE